MTNPTLSSVECEKMSASLPVGDLAAAIEFYVTKLGFRFGFTFGEPATFAGVNLGKVAIFFAEGYACSACRCGVFYGGRC